ncbi:DUF927 domain-containing protein [Acidithiobacillus thiooxidans]|uniref:DUF927 domain-containing protein n=1 Tax=Acidithiobacillus TaxID=119977 RepID=UPI001C06F4F4|nr:DUF927 domain-containing protein [Acidithiobacillus thiooxidans]MBU2837604.1 DUF927 domain-containing protein [Acidithiobacillus thiooxidans]
MENKITVLYTTLDKGSLAKRYWLDETGAIQSDSYANIYEFLWRETSVNSIHGVYELLQECLTMRIRAIIRGHPTPQTRSLTVRTNETFPEDPDGTPWVMLDIDGVPAPEGVDPCSLEAVKHVIGLLPAEFHAVTCAYMFSNSAGIRKPDGSLLKEGIRVHLFFYLDRPVTGKLMAAYLENYCYESQFYTVGLNKGDMPMVSLGIDMAPIKSPVQLHYTAEPRIGPRISVDISRDGRLGLIEESSDVVVMPGIDAALPRAVEVRRQQIREEWALANGFTKTAKRAQLRSGSRSYEILEREGGAVRTGRVLSSTSLQNGGRILQLFFEDEKSPGSWRVHRSRPWLAVRYGDEMEIPLEELCAETIAKVQGLGWMRSTPETIDPEELAQALAEAEPQVAACGEAPVSTLEHTQNQILRNGKLPYSFSDGHIYKAIADKDDDVTYVKIASYIYVYGHLRNAQSQEWSYILHVRNREGKFSEIILPAEELFDHGNFSQILLRSGATIDAAAKKHYLINYIQEYPVQNYFLLVDKLGWTQDQAAFLLPGQIISKTGADQTKKPYLNPAIQNNVAAIKESGTLQEWQGMVAEPCNGNSLLEMMLYISFLPPLLEPLNLPNIGIHLYGETSRGKTTALRVGASVYGDPPGMVHLWRATDNGLETLAYSHNGVILLLDEINQANVKTLGDSIYMLGNGAGKTRAKQDSSLRAAKHWRLVFISTGEVRTDDYLREDGARRVMGGQAVRMLDISIEAGLEMGVVEALGRFSTPGEMVGHLNEASLRFHGTPIVTYLKRLMDEVDADELERRYGETRQRFLSHFEFNNPSPQVARILDHFASIAFAGELAISLGVLPFQADQAITSMVLVARRYLQGREGMEGSDILEVIRRMRGMLSLHRYSNFQHCAVNNGRISFGENRVPNTFWGYYEGELNTPGYYHIPNRIFKDVFCPGVNHKDVLRALHSRGWMAATDAKNFGPERMRCYKISECLVDEYADGPDMYKDEPEDEDRILKELIFEI